MTDKEIISKNGLKFDNFKRIFHDEEDQLTIYHKDCNGLHVFLEERVSSDLDLRPIPCSHAFISLIAPEKGHSHWGKIPCKAHELFWANCHANNPNFIDSLNEELYALWIGTGYIFRDEINFSPNWELNNK